MGCLSSPLPSLFLPKTRREDVSASGVACPFGTPHWPARIRSGFCRSPPRGSPAAIRFRVFARAHRARRGGGKAHARWDPARASARPATAGETRVWPRRGWRAVGFEAAGGGLGGGPRGSAGLRGPGLEPRGRVGPGAGGRDGPGAAEARGREGPREAGPGGSSSSRTRDDLGQVA